MGDTRGEPSPSPGTVPGVTQSLDHDVQREMAVVTAILYGSGGVLVGVAAALARWPDASNVGLAVVVALAGVAALGILVLDRLTTLSIAVFGGSALIGSVVVAAAVVAGGPASAAAYGVFYVYVAAFSAYYYPRWLAAIEIAAAAAAYGAALWIVAAPHAVATWLVVVAASSIGGGLVGVLGNRARHTLEQERHVLERLREVDAMKDVFLRSVSHELRTPLTIVSGFAQLLERHGDELDPERRRVVTERLSVATQRLADLLTSLLDLGEMAQGLAALSPQDVELDELVRSRVRRIDDSSHRIELATEPVRLTADGDRIGRVVDALLDNAVRHTPPGTPIAVSVSRESDLAVITVDDHGPGIPDDLREVVLEPFTHGPTDGDRPSPGTGNGLAFASHVVGMHGGELRVEARPGGGARFRIHLPR